MNHAIYDSYVGLLMYKIMKISISVFKHKEVMFLGIFEPSFRKSPRKFF